MDILFLTSINSFFKKIYLLKCIEIIFFKKVLIEVVLPIFPKLKDVRLKLNFNNMIDQHKKPNGRTRQKLQFSQFSFARNLALVWHPIIRG